MRETDGMKESLFTVAKLGDFVPTNHPLRSIQGLVNTARLGAVAVIERSRRADLGVLDH